MREIKFRGRIIDNSIYVREPVWGNNEKPKLPGEWAAGQFFIHDKGPVIGGFGNWYIVAPATIGQFTGLLDKNGREIYEDDVVRSGNDLILIKWVKAGFMPFRNKDGRFTKQTNWRHTTNGEVIGDVWNNPELLEVTHENS